MPGCQNAKRKQKLIFQPSSMFRCKLAVSFKEGMEVFIQIYIPQPKQIRFFSLLRDLAKWNNISPSPRFPWNKGISLTNQPFGGNRSCEVAIICPERWVEMVHGHPPCALMLKPPMEPRSKKPGVPDTFLLESWLFNDGIIISSLMN